MTSKRDNTKLQNERHQLIIQELLRDDDNKYCADCDAKVHISKVKSVMRDMGNSKARAVYEANLPDNFRRPQTDSALETFIRAKYEQKRYIAHEYVPSKPDVDSLMKVESLNATCGVNIHVGSNIEDQLSDSK
ncbi:unnamed protein product [Trichobilharzia regenti]|nr:unnamed protein product [Trichobilharzia regenti]